MDRIKEHLQEYWKSFSIIHRFSHIYHYRALKEFNLAGHQVGYIICVSKEPGISQENLASILGLNKSAVAKGIRPLIEMGYLERIQSQKDKRAYELYPTKKAEELRHTAGEVSHSFEEILTSGMSPEEIETFKKLLLLAAENVMEAAEEHKLNLIKHPAADDHTGEGCCRYQLEDQKEVTHI